MFFSLFDTASLKKNLVEILQAYFNFKFCISLTLISSRIGTELSQMHPTRLNNLIFGYIDLSIYYSNQLRSKCLRFRYPGNTKSTTNHISKVL